MARLLFISQLGVMEYWSIVFGELSVALPITPTLQYSIIPFSLQKRYPAVDIDRLPGHEITQRRGEE
jgi:hypothetical protein